MGTWSEYELATGLLTGRTISGSDDTRDANARSGFWFVAGEWNPDLYKVDTATGAIINPTPSQIDAYNARPSIYHTWDRTTMTWIDTLPLDQYKAGKVSAIRIEAMSRIAARIPGIDRPEMLEVVKQILLSVVPAARQLTPDLQYIVAVYDAAKSSIQAVRSATTRAEVDAVTPTWPS